MHLRRLEDFLRKLGTYGTALVDPDEALEDTWNGLLVWEIADGARTGVVIRCVQGLPGGAWRYCYDSGIVIAGADELLVVQQALTTLFRERRSVTRLSPRSPAGPCQAP